MLLIENPVFALLAATLLGLCVGSFLNVVIARLPVILEYQWTSQCRELLEMDTGSDNPTSTDPQPPTLSRPRSKCPNCGHDITALENIPVLSYLFLRGKCSGCKTPISVRYPLVEILTAILSFAVVYTLGANWQAAGALVITWCLVALAFIDFDHQILPDNITLPLLWLGLIFNIFAVYCPLQDAVIGAIAGYMILWLVYQAFKILTGKEGMGYGDFKLLAVFGAWLGWQHLPLIILLSAVSGAVIGILLISLRGRDRNIPIPFGPYLAIAGWIAFLWGNQIINFYLRQVGIS